MSLTELTIEYTESEPGIRRRVRYEQRETDGYARVIETRVRGEWHTTGWEAVSDLDIQAEGDGVTNIGP